MYYTKREKVEEKYSKMQNRCHKALTEIAVEMAVVIMITMIPI